MFRAIWFLLKLGLLVAAAVWLAENPGELSMTWLGYKVDTSVAFLVLVMLVLATLFALLYRFWRSIVTAPTALSRYYYYRRRDKGYDAITRGLLHVAAGDPDGAAKQAGKASAYLPDPPLSKLLSAQAALMKGDNDKAHKLFEDMAGDRDSAFLGLRGLVADAVRNKDWEAALGYARRAASIVPKSEWALTTLFDLETRTARWRDAETTLKKALKAGVIDKDSWRRHQVALQLGLSLSAEENGDDAKAMHLAKSANRQDRSAPHAALRYARMLHKVGRRGAAVKVIEKTWSSAPHPGLARLWVDLAPAPKKKADANERAMAKVKWYNRLAALNPASSTSAALAAEAALDASLWGEARQHLERALENEPSAEIFRLMARLERGENKDDDKAQYWMERAATAMPDKVWQCGACGHIDEEWTPLCPECGAFNTLSWGHPDLRMNEVMALATTRSGRTFSALPIYD